jgi:hypothetical protein
MSKAFALLFGVTLLFAGCVTPPPARIVDIEKVTPLTGLPPLPVRCAPEVWNRVEELNMIGLPFRFSTGEVFTSVFNGTRAEQPGLDVVESSLTGKITDLGFTALVTYKARIALTVKETRRELSAEHTEAFHGFSTPATQAKIVIETVVADLYRQVKPLL